MQTLYHNTFICFESRGQPASFPQFGKKSFGYSLLDLRLHRVTGQKI